ncbi:hypothetical protein RIF29_25435 [Crotalaria pallida]|uniref:Reverse transcriptase zinc-binding domain-containing protein n=1 Tax=Crotalaria pallida TaxID=3830 RepID=A0AAN9ENR6_CROPI
MESKKKVMELNVLKTLYDRQNLYGVDCSGNGNSRAGGLVLLWHNGITVTILSSSSNHIDARIVTSEEGVVFHATFLYGYPNGHDKKHTWDLLSRLKRNSSDPWVVIGDYNQILGPEDKVGGAGCDFAEIQAARDCLHECGLTEVGFVGSRFTWCNRRKSPDTIEERLDRAFANQSWLDIWQFSLINNLPRHRSDHSPISLDASTRPKKQRRCKKKRYRFEQVWIHYEELVEVVKHSWISSDSVAGNIERVGANLLEWGEKKNGDENLHGIHKVSELIWPHSKSWNINLLHQIFSPYEANMISQIPLSLRNNKDVQIWRHTDNGEYSVKSGYWQIIQGEESGESSHHVTVNSNLWRKIWKVQSIPRCKDLAWRACKNILPVRSRLQHRGVSVDARCPLCGEEEETITHALLTCPMVSPVWFASPLTIRIDTGHINEFGNWLLQILDMSSKFGESMVLDLLYAIWTARNEWCFNGKKAIVMQILDRAAAYMIPPSLSVPNCAVQAETSQQSEASFFISHVDASLDVGCGLGVGHVTKNLDGDFMPRGLV